MKTTTQNKDVMLQSQINFHKSFAKMSGGFKLTEEKRANEAKAMEDFKQTWNRMEKNISEAELKLGDTSERAFNLHHIYDIVCALYEKAIDNNSSAYSLFSTLRTKASGLLSKDYQNMPKETFYSKILALEPVMIACGELCGVEVPTFEDAFKKRLEERASKPQMRPI